MRWPRGLSDCRQQLTAAAPPTLLALANPRTEIALPLMSTGS